MLRFTSGLPMASTRLVWVSGGSLIVFVPLDRVQRLGCLQNLSGFLVLTARFFVLPIPLGCKPWDAARSSNVQALGPTA